MIKPFSVTLKKDGKNYIVSFDEYGDMDTVVCNGEFLSTKNRVVQQILKGEQKIRDGLAPTGFERG